MHIDPVVVLSFASAAVLLSLAAAASFAYVRMFGRYRIPLCGWCRSGAEDDLELGAAEARVAPAEEEEEEEEEKSGGGRGAAVRLFSWPDVEVSTRKFAASSVVGEGGSSTVYVARLADSSLAAVKLHRRSERLHRAFRQELDVLLHLSHPYIVRLLGYCDEREEEGVLVFEYVPNGCLHERLHGAEKALPWARRMALAYQVAQALEYLHEACDPQVVHGDVKSANVLLDGAMEVKLCDFGSARVGFSAAVAPPRSGRAMVVGSPGYVDPHYLRSGMVSKKSDVYSFGVLLLELVTGAEAFDAERELRLTAAMAPLLREPERSAEGVDARLGQAYDAGEAKAMVELAAMCVGDNPSLRPSMAEVVRLLRERAASSIDTAAVASKADGKD